MFYLMITKDGSHNILDTEYESSIDAANAGEVYVNEGRADSYSTLSEQVKKYLEEKGEG